MKKTIILCLSFFYAALFTLSCASTQTLAISNCTQLNNGGITDKQYCFNPTPKPQSGSGVLPNTKITSIPANKPQQTKGGQTIYPSTQSKTTPSTGPEEWSLPALFLIGGLGFWLRKKTKLM